MKLTTILFDLDGTLLPMDQEEFVAYYFKLLSQKLSHYGYQPKQLIDAVWAGTAAMIRNDGRCANEDVFWQCFSQYCGSQILEDKPLFEAFYANEFAAVKQVCGFQPLAAATIQRLKEKGFQLVLATNPIFPSIATQSRIRWAGLEPTDFTLYTTYENTGYCKPNSEYYRDILERINAKPEECLMVGNDVDEDMVAAVLGIRVFLLTDCLINKSNKDINAYPHGSFPDLAQFLAL